MDTKFLQAAFEVVGGLIVFGAFGWAKTIGGLGRMKLKGTGRMGFAFTFAMVAYNLIRSPS